MRKLVAETLGTFALVFVGTGAVIVNDISDGAVTHVGISLVFGLIVLAMIYAIGDDSGCHINPAVTIGFFAAGRFAGRRVFPYIVSQCVGAILASFSLLLMFPDHESLGGTHPRGSALQSFMLEIVMTWLLMFVVMRVSTGSKEKGVLAGVAVGSVIALEALFAGPISGASMNPARTLGPALAEMRLNDLWIYIAAPILGSLLGVVSHWCIQEPDAPAKTLDEI